jgi:hypothetical protein
MKKSQDKKQINPKQNIALKVISAFLIVLSFLNDGLFCFLMMLSGIGDPPRQYQAEVMARRSILSSFVCIMQLFMLLFFFFGLWLLNKNLISKKFMAGLATAHIGYYLVFFIFSYWGNPPWADERFMWFDTLAVIYFVVVLLINSFVLWLMLKLIKYQKARQP